MPTNNTSFAPFRRFLKPPPEANIRYTFIPLQGLKLSEEDSPGCFGKSVFFHAHVCTYTFFFLTVQKTSSRQGKDTWAQWFQYTTLQICCWQGRDITLKKKTPTPPQKKNPQKNHCCMALNQSIKPVTNNRPPKRPPPPPPPPQPPSAPIWWNKSSFWYWTTK